ncbi:MAG: hypothetical protein ABI806_08875 [Candidatus Solibacter sp.]
MKTVCIVMLCAVMTAAAGTRFQPRRMVRNDVPAGKGQCDIRLQVDNEVHVTVRGGRVDVKTLSGRDARDDGSECNLPIPKDEVRGFRFEVIDKRGEIQLVEEPSRRNHSAAIVHIRDTAGGEGRYHFRLSWEIRNYDFDRPPTGGGFSWNNAASYKGKGLGKTILNGREEMVFRQVTMEIDQSGKMAIWFAPERGRPVSFTGQLQSNNGGKLKVDVMSEDRRMRGPMWITVDPKKQVQSVSLEATDGQDRLQLAWNRK